MFNSQKRRWIRVVDWLGRGAHGHDGGLVGGFTHTHHLCCKSACTSTGSSPSRDQRLWLLFPRSQVFHIFLLPSGSQDELHKLQNFGLVGVATDRDARNACLRFFSFCFACFVFARVSFHLIFLFFFCWPKISKNEKHQNKKKNGKTIRKTMKKQCKKKRPPRVPTDKKIKEML